MKLHRSRLYFALLPLFAATPGGADDWDHHSSGAQLDSPILELVRSSTARFRDVANAVAEGYGPGPCVSGPNGGAMGIHYVNGALVADGLVDPTRPEALIYEPQPGGRLRLVGVEYITLAEAWEAGNVDPPILEGNLFNYVGSPNRYRIPAFYELHVWAWRTNPDGTFADWNPRVSCDAYDPA